MLYLKINFIICHVLFYLDTIGAHNEKGCDIEGISEEEWENGKFFEPKFQNETIRYEFDLNEPIKITGTCKKFFSIRNSNKKLIVEGRSEIKQIDQMVQPTNIFNILCKIWFKCKKGESVLTLNQPILDTNDYPPIFYNETYQVVIPSSGNIPPGTQINKYLDGFIQVEDLDFSNNDITFAIDPDDFEVETEVFEVDRRRIFTPVIKTRRGKMIGSSRYTLKATDSGSYPSALSSSISITIQQRIINDSLHFLHFERPSYEATYFKDKIFIKNDIKLYSNCEDLLLYLDSDAEFDDLFYPIYDSRREIVLIKRNQTESRKIDERIKETYLGLTVKGESCESSAEIKINFIWKK